MYRTICCELWTDDKVIALTPHEKLLFLYLITNPHSHLSGIYYMPTAFIEHEVNLGRAFDGAWKGLLRYPLVQYEPHRSQVWVVNMLKFQARGQKSEKGVANHLSSLHPSPMIERFLVKYPEIVQHLPTSFVRYPIEGASIPHRTFPSPVPDPVPDPVPSSVPVLIDGFDLFWSAYPRKKSKDQAVRAYTKAVKHDQWPGVEEVVKVIGQLKQSNSWTKDGGEFIPYPATWLNAAGWLDEVRIEVEQVPDSPMARQIKAFLGEEGI